MPYKLLTPLFFCLPLLNSGAWAQPANTEADFQQRKQLLVDQLSSVVLPSNRNLPDPEKHHWPKAIARFAKYGNSDTSGNFRVISYRNNSPFHFTLVGWARLQGLFPQADSMVKYRSRYFANAWNRADSYNPFTGEGTENHLNMSKSAGYLLAQWSLGNPQYPQAAQRMAEMKQWILRYSKLVYTGGTGEWNSSTYQAYNVAGWLNLYDFAQDTSVRACARAVLDYYATEIALHYSKGAVGGAEMRGSLGSSPSSSYDYLAWMWFGITPRDATQASFWVGREYSQSIHAATSRYRPPANLNAIAQKQTVPATGWYYSQAHGDYLLQPYGNWQNFFVSPSFTLGALYTRYSGWTNASFQIIPWKLVADVAGGPSANTQVVTGNGRYWNTWQGRFRTPYDQLVQHKNVLIQMTRVPADTAAKYAAVKAKVNQWRTDWQRDFLLRFPPPNDTKAGGNPVQAPTPSLQPNAGYISYPNPASSVANGGVRFVELEKIYLAIRSLYQAAPSNEAVEPNSSNARMKIEDAAPLDSICGFILEASEKTGYASFQAFQTAYLQRTRLYKAALQGNQTLAYRTMAGDSVVARYELTANYVPNEPIFDWGYNVTQPQTDPYAANWLTPSFAIGTTGTAKVASWSVNGTPYALSTTGMPVISGPGIRLDSLKLSVGNGQYYVNYTDSIPKFGPASPVAISTSDLASPKLLIYPNPTRGKFKVRMVNGCKLCPYEAFLIDPQGRVVARLKGKFNALSEDVINLERHIPGTYRFNVKANGISVSSAIDLG